MRIKLSRLPVGLMSTSKLKQILAENDQEITITDPELAQSVQAGNILEVNFLGDWVKEPYIDRGRMTLSFIAKIGDRAVRPEVKHIVNLGSFRPYASGFRDPATGDFFSFIKTEGWATYRAESTQQVFAMRLSRAAILELGKIIEEIEHRHRLDKLRAKANWTKVPKTPSQMKTL